MSGQIGTGIEAYLQIGGSDIDAIPTENSENPVSSGGVYNALLNAVPSLQQVLEKDGFAVVETEDGQQLLIGITAGAGKTAALTIGNLFGNAIINFLVQGGGDLSVQTSPGKFLYNGKEVATIDDVTLQKVMEKGSEATFLDSLQKILIEHRKTDFTKWSKFEQTDDRFNFSSSHGFNFNALNAETAINSYTKINGLPAVAQYSGTRSNTNAYTISTVPAQNTLNRYFSYSGNAATIWTLPSLANGNGTTISISNKAYVLSRTLTLNSVNTNEIWYKGVSLSTIIIPINHTIVLHCDGINWIVKDFDYLYAINSTSENYPTGAELNSAYPYVPIGFTVAYTHQNMGYEFTKTTNLGHWAEKQIQGNINP